MLITFKHPEYQSIELVDNSLIIQPIQGEAKTLQAGVIDLAVAVENEEIKLIAFTAQDYAWFFHGKKEFGQSRLDLAQKYGGGGKLIIDRAGNSHLFYFGQQSLGQGVTLRHQVLRKNWSNPVMVAANVFARGSNYSVTWHSDNYLHIAYCNHREQHLFYRVFDLEQEIWSGAVPFAKEKCTDPHLISSTKLYLFWREDKEGSISLKVRTKEKTWSAPSRIGASEQVDNLGYGQDRDLHYLFWTDGHTLYQVPFDHWTKIAETKREFYTYQMRAQAEGILALYTPTVASASFLAQELSQAPQTEQLASREELRLLEEWRKFREEIKNWQASFVLPRTQDLTPLINRLERLEKRLFTVQQKHEQEKQTLEQRLKMLEDQLSDLELEPSFWRRLLKRL